MSKVQSPDKCRLISAFRTRPADRVPNWEFLLMKQNTEAIIGSDRLNKIKEDYKNLLTVWPPRSESEKNDLSPLADYSCYLPSEDYRNLLESTAQDAVCCTLSWKPKPRSREHEGIIAKAQDGVIKDRSGLSNLPKPPSADDMMVPLDYYLKDFNNTNIGVGILLRSVLSNTYETLGMENFMLKFYDDPQLIRILMDLFLDYSLGIIEALKYRKIDFLAIDDDICDNSGFMVNPDYIKEQWVPRTKEIINPILSKDIPVIYHCCGNIKDVIPIVIDMGITAIHPVQPNCNDIYRYKKEFGADLCLFGNIDIAGVLAHGTPEEVRDDTRRHIELLAPGGGYVVGSSHSITDDIRPENYRAMIEATWEYGRY